MICESLDSIWNFLISWQTFTGCVIGYLGLMTVEIFSSTNNRRGKEPPHSLAVPRKPKTQK